MAKATYKDAGVDLEVYRQSMARLPRLLGRTYTPRVLPLEGGFAGLFQLDFANQLFARNYEEPVLVSCTDGVGTKLKVAVAAGIHTTVGIDLVAMSVNDALCCGAEPLFFLDYVAMPKDDPDLLEQIVEGITAGCMQADCALLGGETAIMPDIYAPGDYDLAGFCVGVVPRKQTHRRLGHRRRATWSWASPRPGCIPTVTAWPERSFSTLAGLKVEDHVEELGQTVGQALLEPTRIYVRPIRQVLTHYRVKNVVHGIAHITGGGLHENLARIVPQGVRVLIRRGSWPVPTVFGWMQRLGEVDQAEMDQVFNLGIGMVLVVSPYYAESIQHQLAQSGVESWQIGNVQPGSGGVTWEE